MKNIICRHFQKELFPKLKFAYNNLNNINWTTYNTPCQKSTNFSHSVTILLLMT